MINDNSISGVKYVPIFDGTGDALQIVNKFFRVSYLYVNIFALKFLALICSSFVGLVSLSSNRANLCQKKMFICLDIHSFLEVFMCLFAMLRKLSTMSELKFAV